MCLGSKSSVLRVNLYRCGVVYAFLTSPACGAKSGGGCFGVSAVMVDGVELTGMVVLKV